MSFPKFLNQYHYAATNSGENHDFVVGFSSQGCEIVVCGATVTRGDLESQILGSRVLRWCLGTINWHFEDHVPKVINRAPLMGERGRRIEKQTYDASLRKSKEVGRAMSVW